MADFEAMAGGPPVVATSVGGLLEFLEHGDIGCSISPLYVAALTNCLRLLLRDPMCRQDMGAAARQHVRENFSADHMVAEIEAIYDSLVP